MPNQQPIGSNASRVAVWLESRTNDQLRDLDRRSRGQSRDNRIVHRDFRTQLEYVFTRTDIEREIARRLRASEPTPSERVMRGRTTESLRARMRDALSQELNSVEFLDENEAPIIVPVTAIANEIVRRDMEEAALTPTSITPEAIDRVRQMLDGQNVPTTNRIAVFPENMREMHVGTIEGVRIVHGSPSRALVAIEYKLSELRRHNFEPSVIVITTALQRGMGGYLRQVRTTVMPPPGSVEGEEEEVINTGPQIEEIQEILGLRVVVDDLIDGDFLIAVKGGRI
jgi:hypothetical protein